MIIKIMFNVNQRAGTVISMCSELCGNTSTLGNDNQVRDNSFSGCVVPHPPLHNNTEWDNNGNGALVRFFQTLASIILLYIRRKLHVVTLEQVLNY